MRFVRIIALALGAVVAAHAGGAQRQRAAWASTEPSILRAELRDEWQEGPTDGSICFDPRALSAPRKRPAQPMFWDERVPSALLADSRVALDSTGAGGRYSHDRQCAPTGLHPRVAPNMRFKTLAPAVVASTAPCLGAASHRPGFTWTYSGTRLMASAAGDRERRERITWVTTMVDTQTVNGATLALVRGFVTQLAWSNRSTTPRLSILVCSMGRLSQFEGENDNDVRKAFADWHASQLERSRVLLVTPLHPGQRFGQDPHRTDGLYGWDVERIDRRANLTHECGAQIGGAFRLTHRTNPDVSRVDWQLGAGVVGYRYEHHGTPASVEVHLVSCRQGR
jgi:hypothetical protein